MEKDKNELFTKEQRAAVKDMIKEYILEQKNEKEQRKFEKWRDNLRQAEYEAFPGRFRGCEFRWGNESGIS